MTNVFNEQYAASYDAVYADKNYDAECDAISKLVNRFGDGKIQHFLDIGCGTGRHAVALAKRGFSITGIDQSEPMLAHARKRAAQEGLSEKLEFRCGDMRAFVSGRHFDTVLMNFNVIGYMTTNDDVLAAFATARRNVRKSGLLIADFWYGPAVNADPPAERTREYDDRGDLIIRTSTGTHLPHEQSCQIAIKIIRFRDGQIIAQDEEAHNVRYFFPLEIELFLRSSRFHLLGLTGFPEVDAAADTRKWPAAVAAKAI